MRKIATMERNPYESPRTIAREVVANDGGFFFEAGCTLGGAFAGLLIACGVSALWAVRFQDRLPTGTDLLLAMTSGVPTGAVLGWILAIIYFVSLVAPKPTDNRMHCD